MKSFLKKQLEKLLANLARWTLAKYEPSVIGITGSVGKTSAKEAVYAALKDFRSTRASQGSFNNEIGLPLTILGDWKEIRGLFFWPQVILHSIYQLLIRQKYPEILVLEYGVQKPGDMRYLLDIAKPSMAIMTALGDTPVHVEYFGSPESLMREKAKLLEAVPAIGFVILNDDDDAVSSMDERTRAHIMRFGYSKDADVRVSNFETLLTEERPFGISFKLNYGGGFVPMRFANIFGRSHSYAISAAVCVGLIFGVNLVRLAEGLGNNYNPPPHRMRYIAGLAKSAIIDDTYNASPLSMRAAIDTVKDIKAKRKIAVLGDMRELGKYSIQAHEAIGLIVGEVFDILVTVGSQAKFIAESARAGGGMPPKSVMSFETAEEAMPFVRSLIKYGDLVLVKASRAIGLDKLVEEIKMK